MVSGQYPRTLEVTFNKIALQYDMINRNDSFKFLKFEFL